MTTLKHVALTVTGAQFETKRTVEVRCPIRDCACSERGKLLAILIDVPAEAFGSGAILQVACPKKKSRLVKIRL
jgi:hypothetical protein